MKLLFPGTFDPFTTGHADLVARALRVADSIVIAVGVNPAKKTLWSAEERVEAIRKYYASEPRISVVSYSCLTMDLLQETGADIILRGVRTVADYEVERNLADANRAIGGADTMLLVSSPEYQHVSSSLVRELIEFGHPVDGMMIDSFVIH